MYVCTNNTFIINVYKWYIYNKPVHLVHLYMNIEHDCVIRIKWVWNMTICVHISYWKHRFNPGWLDIAKKRSLLSFVDSYHPQVLWLKDIDNRFYHSYVPEFNRKACCLYFLFIMFCLFPNFLNFEFERFTYLII